MATVTATMTPKPYFLQAVGADTPISYTAEDFRNVLGAMWPRSGVSGPLSFRILQRLAGANWSVDINGGFAILGNTATEIDRYLCSNDARVNIPLTGFNTAPAATRTHRVFIAVYDKAVVGTQYLTKVVITEDVGAGAPLPSDSPAYTLEIGSVSIGSGQSNIATANIANYGIHADASYGAYDLALSGGVISGAGGTNGGPPRYSMAGNQIRLSGVAAKSSGNYLAGSTYSMAVLPDGSRPRYERYCAALGAGGNRYRVTVTTAGLIQASAIGTDMAWLAFDGVTFELD